MKKMMLPVLLCLLCAISCNNNNKVQKVVGEKQSYKKTLSENYWIGTYDLFGDGLDTMVCTFDMDGNCFKIIPNKKAVESILSNESFNQWVGKNDFVVLEEPLYGLKYHGIELKEDSLIDFPYVDIDENNAYADKDVFVITKIDENTFKLYDQDNDLPPVTLTKIPYNNLKNAKWLLDNPQWNN